MEINNDINKTIFKIINNRFDDYKHYYQILVAIIATMFTIIAIIFGAMVYAFNKSYDKEIDKLNISKESMIKDINIYKEDIKKELIHSKEKPKLEIFTIKNEPFANQEIETTFAYGEEKDKKCLHIKYVLKNNGKGHSGLLWVKLLAPKHIVPNESIEDKKYSGEVLLSPANLDPNQLPGNCSVTFTMHLKMPKTFIIKPGKYSALLKLYDGHGDIVQAPFTILVP